MIAISANHENSVFSQMLSHLVRHLRSAPSIIDYNIDRFFNPIQSFQIPSKLL